MQAPLRPFLFALTFFIFPALLYADSQAALYPGFPKIEESKAYKTLLKRGVSHKTVLTYLIDRYADAKIRIVYDEYRVDSRFAANLARIFLLKQYRGEAPEEWIYKWCNTSIISGKAIWVELPDESLVLSREVLQAELDALSDLMTKTNVKFEPFKKA